MNRHVGWRILIGVVLIGAVLGLGALAYNAGMTRGLALGAQEPVGEAASAPLPVYLLPYGRPWVGPGFGFFGMLMGLFLLFVIFGAIRALLWPRRWSHRMMRHAAWQAAAANGWRDWPGCASTVFDEWHRRAHAETGAEPAKS